MKNGKRPKAIEKTDGVKHRYDLRLYVAGQTPRSLQALSIETDL
jgi:hypothetical protein